MRLPARTLWAYAAPGLGKALMIAPFPALIAAFYATRTGATTAGIATVLLVVRLVDALVDPSIGMASDATRSRFGARKPWIAAGAALGAVAFLVLFRPPPGAGDAWFALGMVLYYPANALIDIPLRAWAGEIAHDYVDRSRIAAYLTFTVLGGGLLFLALPTVLSLPQVGVVETAALGRRMMAIFGGVGAVALPLLTLVALLAVPTGEARREARHGFATLLRAIRDNRPMWLFLAADALTQVGWGLTYSLLFIAIDGYWRLSAATSLILLSATVAQIVAIPVYTRLANRIGRHIVWGWASIAGALVVPLLLLFPPGGRADVAALCCVVAVASALGTPNLLFPMALVTDIADYDAWRSRRRRGATFYALRLLTYKGAFAVGGAAGFYVLAAIGFDPKAAANPPAATTALLATLVVVPGVLMIAAGALLLRFPLDRRRHAIIRRRLDSLEARSAAPPGFDARPGAA